MKKIFQLGLLSMLAVACVAERQETPQLAAGDGELVAAIENAGTRTSVDETLQVLWDTGDCISVFRETVENRCYQLKGEGGVSSGVFKSIETPSPSISADLPYIIAVYPYDKEITAYENGDVILTLPAEQAYAPDSFGPGANTMVAVSEDKNLSFKNLCGFVAVQLQGDVAVNSITLRTNASEPIAGSATVETSLDEEPAVLMNIKGGNEIVMSCDEAVQLKANEPTLFWFVVPPATYEEGFSIEVEYNDGYVFEKEGTQSQTVERNTLIKMAALTITAPKTLPYSEPFDEENGFGAFTTEDITDPMPEGLNYVWNMSSNNGVFFAKGSAYVGGTQHQAESWLLSPEIDLTQEKQAVLSFKYALNYGDPSDYASQFFLMVIDGDDWTWVNVEGLPEKGSWTFYDAVVDLSAFCGDIVKVAFVYNSLGQKSALTIEINDVVFDRTAAGVITAPATLSLTLGDKGKAIDAIVNSGAQLSYASSDEKVATVDADGVVTPVAEGTATITVSAPATGIYGAAEATVEVTVSAPTQYERFTGAFQDGEYLIVYTASDNTSRAMKNTISKNRLDYLEVAPDEDDIITNPDASIVWTIAKCPTDNYWTIYNAAVKKYAASNGTKNQAALSDSDTADKSLWTIDAAYDAGGFEFINKYNAENKVNANLRNNTTYGFACYGTGTGGPVLLYKKVEQ